MVLYNAKECGYFEYLTALELGLTDPSLNMGQYTTVTSKVTPILHTFFTPICTGKVFDKYVRTHISIKYRVVKGVVTISCSYKDKEVSQTVPYKDYIYNRHIDFNYRLHFTIRYCAVAAIAAYYIDKNLIQENYNGWYNC